MSAYYNEIDRDKAEWIRELIKAGIVAPGDVDERSITDVSADDVRGYTQCHFFAGIACWSYALRLAGWPDDKPVWTGSCPCPSFSCAGKGEGFDDPRHLWPEWYRLIRECRPGAVFGEQVAAAIGHGWLDLVCGDMEAENYAIAPAVLGAHSAGSPNIRQRLYIGAHTKSERRREGLSFTAGSVERSDARQESQRLRRSDAGERPDPEMSQWRRTGNTQHSGGGDAEVGGSGVVGELSYSDGRQSQDGNLQRSGEQRLLATDCGTGNGSDSEHDGHDSSDGTEAIAHRNQPTIGLLDRDDGAIGGDDALGSRLEGLAGDAREWRGPGWLDPITARSVAETGATRGFWGDCDWWYGRDGKYRPIGPGLFPLAHGASARVLRLRGYGDAINPWVAKAFIESFVEAQGGNTDV